MFFSVLSNRAGRQLAIALIGTMAPVWSAAAETGTLNLIEQSRTHSAKAAKAYQQKDFVSSLRLFRKAYALRPYHPGLIYNVAALEARAGSPDSALAFLDRIVAMKLYFPPQDDADFEALQSDPRFIETVAAINRNNEPVIRSQLITRVAESDLLTEGIAFVPYSGSFFVGSIYRRKVVRVEQNGHLSDFLRYPEDHLFGVFGMAVSADNQYLWLCTSDIEQISDRKTPEHGKAAVVVCDLDSASRIKRFEPADTLDHILGDLVLAGPTQAYVSDSRTNVISRISLAEDGFETVAGPGYFGSLQGIATADNNLFAADYAQGIFRVDLTNKEVSEVKHGENICLLGIDGLYFYENSLIAIQNGVRPHRIIRLFLDDGGNSIIRFQVLESNNPLFDEPTLGTLFENDFYFIANSQWRKFKDDGSGPDQEVAEPVILKIDLD
jgi:hypothetical protein